MRTPLGDLGGPVCDPSTMVRLPLATLNDRNTRFLVRQTHGPSSPMMSGSATPVMSDALAEVLRVTRSGWLAMAHVVAGDPWGLDVADSGGATLHAVTAGTALAVRARTMAAPAHARRHRLVARRRRARGGQCRHRLRAVELGRVAKVQRRTPGRELRCRRRRCPVPVPVCLLRLRPRGRPPWAAPPPVVHTPAGEHGPGTAAGHAGSGAADVDRRADQVTDGSATAVRPSPRRPAGRPRAPGSPDPTPPPVPLADRPARPGHRCRVRPSSSHAQPARAWTGAEPGPYRRRVPGDPGPPLRRRRSANRR